MEINPEKSFEIMDTLEIFTIVPQQQHTINTLQLPLPQQLGMESTDSFSNDLEMSESTDSKDDQCRSEATFSYTIDNIATLELTKQQLSPPVYVGMLPWRILLIPNERGLGFFLQCNGENDSPSWTCHATAELRLKCHKPDAPPFTRARMKHLFCAKENDYGYMNFITWQDLEDPDMHYVNNGSLTLEVHVVATVQNDMVADTTSPASDHVAKVGDGSNQEDQLDTESVEETYVIIDKFNETVAENNSKDDSSAIKDENNSADDTNGSKSGDDFETIAVDSMQPSKANRCTIM